MYISVHYMPIKGYTCWFIYSYVLLSIYLYYIIRWHILEHQRTLFHFVSIIQLGGQGRRSSITQLGGQGRRSSITQLGWQGRRSSITQLGGERRRSSITQLGGQGRIYIYNNKCTCWGILWGKIKSDCDVDLNALI